MIASFPSPSSGALSLGPLSIHAYGLMIALGVVAAVWLSGRRLEARGAGTRDDMSAIAVWGVVAGVIGARLYFIVTDKSEPWRHPGSWIKIWEGGLGIPGGLLAGITVGLWAAHRRGISPATMATVAAPALPLAQAIGRWGNYFNQELFGRPTTLPWALRVSDSKTIEAGYPPGTTFHPTFLYESLWNLALCGLLLWIDRRFKLRPGRLMAVYLAGYFAGRFWIEGLRIDPANAVGGLRLNQWVALAVVAGAVLFLVIDALRHRHEPQPVEVDDYVAVDE
jgi:prolipoprotein diacylglyceryl transferase